MGVNRTRVVRGVSCAVALLGIGCSGQSAFEDENVGSQSSALIGDFSINDATVTTQGVGGDALAALRLGYGPNKDWLVSYQRPSGNFEWQLYTGFAPGTLKSSQRPFRWWRDTGFTFSTIYHDSSAGGASRVFEHTGSPVVQPIFPGRNVAPAGPVSSLQMRSGVGATFGRFGNEILHSYVPTNSSAWSEFSLGLIAEHPISHVALPPTGSPLAVRRSFDSDSVWYTCGPDNRTYLCEYRSGAVGNGQEGQTSVTEFATDVGQTFANVSFIEGTRPTALSTPGAGGTSFADRWVFAATVDNSTGGKRVVAKRDTLPASTTTADPVYQGFGIEGALEYKYSTPMPFVRTDGYMAVLYFRNSAVSGSTDSTKVMYSAFVGGAWSTPTVIHDVGVQLPAGYDITPFVDSTATDRNAALFRLPYSDGARETVLLTQSTATSGWIKSILPAPTASPTLLMLSADKLYTVDSSNGNRTQLGASSWSGSSALTSDRSGLAYAIQGTGLWEINLNSGERRSIASAGYSNNTLLTFGSVLEIPTPFDVGSGHVQAIDLANGAQIDRGPGYTNATALSFSGSPIAGGTLNAIVDGTLWRIDTSSGAQTRLGQPSEWPNDTLLASNRRGKLFAYQQSLGLFEVEPSTGAWAPVSAAPNLVAQTTAFDSATWIKTRTSAVADSVAGPDGTVTAELLKETTGNGTHSAYQNVTVDPTKNYTFSVYAKQGGRRYLDIYLTTPDETSSGAEIVADLQTGTVVVSGGGGSGVYTGSSVQPVGDGWYRVSVSGKPRTAAGTQVRVQAYLMQSPTVASYTGDGSSGFYLWGAELKASSAVATSNLEVDTSAFESVRWTKARLSLAETNSSTQAPDATNSAERVAETATTGSHCLYQNVQGTDPSRIYTWSINIRPNGRTAFHVMLDSAADPASAVAGRFDLNGSGGVFSGSASGSGTHVSSTIKALANGWYRLSVTGKPTTVVSNQMYVEVCAVSSVIGSLSYAGDTSKGFWIWGARLRGNLDPTLSPPLKALVDMPASCGPNAFAAADCQSNLFAVRSSGDLVKLSGVTKGGGVLASQVLAGSTWPGTVLMATRDY